MIGTINFFGFDWLNYFIYKTFITDMDNIVKRRKDNNTFLKITMNYPSIEHIRDNPFAYPLLFKNEQERDEFQKKLTDNKIYPKIYWQNNHPTSKKILFMPTDQRYTPNDYNLNRII